jgi:hypothetical protein
VPISALGIERTLVLQSVITLVDAFKSAHEITPGVALAAFDVVRVVGRFNSPAGLSRVRSLRPVESDNA